MRALDRSINMRFGGKMDDGFGLEALSGLRLQPRQQYPLEQIGNSLCMPSSPANLNWQHRSVCPRLRLYLCVAQPYRTDKTCSPSHDNAHWSLAFSVRTHVSTNFQSQLMPPYPRAPRRNDEQNLRFFVFIAMSEVDEFRIIADIITPIIGVGGHYK